MQYGYIVNINLYRDTIIIAFLKKFTILREIKIKTKYCS